MRKHSYGEEEDKKLWYREYSHMNRFSRTIEGWKVGGNHQPDRISFKVNRQVNIIGFGIYGSVKPVRMTGTIKVALHLNNQY